MKYLFRYSGKVTLKNNPIVSWDFSGSTVAESKEKAISNLTYQMWKSPNNDCRMYQSLQFNSSDLHIVKII